MTDTSQMVDYFSDVLNSHAASRDDSADFVLRTDGNKISYVDVENGRIWLLTVEEGLTVPAP